ncbi:MAG: zeta toxin family protein [Verrucomicrobia bacterium]|nr:zeta toxin family protein [Verrucomicrobiota bacterium]MCH8510597.1 zeta toxin family protein [Kiritimatiellia bacterium]
MTASSPNKPTLYVLAGVNGAGKSSIGERIFSSEESKVFNPDTIASKIRALRPDISLALANGHAWQIGKSLLEQAMEAGKDYRFETTLGGRSITRLLQQAAQGGHRLNIWFCGLESPALHLRRVRARVKKGGHDIPEDKIRERWNGSRENLIRLLPHIHHLRVYDNSTEGDPAKGHPPHPVLVLEMQCQTITAPADLSHAPDWAQPIVAAAIHLHRRGN